MADYVYSVASDTLNAVCSPGNLSDEIAATALSTPDAIVVDDDVLTVTYTIALSSGEQTTLSSTIGSHTGVDTDSDEEEMTDADVSSSITAIEADIVALQASSASLPEFFYASSPSVQTTTSESYQTKVTLSETLVGGTYRIDVQYGWSLNSTADDFISRVLVDGSQEGELHYQEPQDSSGSWGSTGTNQRHTASRRFVKVLSAGAHTVTLQWRTSDADEEASIWDALIMVTRVA